MLTMTTERPGYVGTGRYWGWQPVHLLSSGCASRALLRTEHNGLHLYVVSRFAPPQKSIHSGE